LITDPRIWLGIVAGCVASWAAEPPLVTAMRLRGMSIAEAELGHRVKIRGVVVFVEPSAVFVQDETSTTFFKPRPEHRVEPGQTVETVGPTRMGLYLPGISVADEVRITGRAPLPPPRRLGFDDITSGRYHYQRVEIDGVVRSIEPLEARRTLIRLAVDSRILEVQVDALANGRTPALAARVKVTGLVAGLIAERRLLRPYLLVQTWGDIEIRQPPPVLVELPRISAAQLLAYRADGRREDHVSIAGTVTAVFPRGEIFLADGDVAFRAVVVPGTELRSGDQVLLAGYPEMGASDASVVDAAVAERPTTGPVKALAVGAPGKLDRQHNSKLVAVTGEIVDIFRGKDSVTLLLQGGGRTIDVDLPAAGPDLAPRARVTVAGICQIGSVVPKVGFSTNVADIRVRVRDLRDVALVARAPWWTVGRMAAVLATVSALAGAAGLWIGVLRTQVRRQTAALRRRIEAEAALEERHRIAREFHDSLEQELAGVSLRLDALATRVDDPAGKDFVAESRTLIARIQSETHDLICDLRDPTETAGDLVGALGNALRRQAGETGTDLRLGIDGKIPPLPAAAVHDLRMIARESVSNAINHGAATQVRVQLAADRRAITMRVVDNGRGFPAPAAAADRHAHFGCAGIRERARRMGATVAWESVPGKGVTVATVLPLGAAKPAAPAPASRAVPALSPEGVAR
jgi:signal transduction histidine kinase